MKSFFGRPLAIFFSASDGIFQLSQKLIKNFKSLYGFGGPALSQN